MSDSKDVDKTIDEDLVVTKYKMAGEIVNTFEQAVKSYPSAELLITGDSNLPGFSWQINNSVVYASGSSSSGAVEQGVSALELIVNQCNVKSVFCAPNVYGNFLDLMFSTVMDSISEISLDPLIDNDKFHSALITTIPSKSTPYFRSDEFIFNSNMADYNKINAELAKIDWNSIITENMNIDIAVGKFYNCLYGVIAGNVPYAKKFISTYPVWFDKDLRGEVKLKKKFHAIFEES
ncbi:hypothetical protein QAD02_013060 [Eretmocerus hayati]|uniref:Uncharacterized protein n=1 Tax=Eretmocerus hayati TaxID=131215 RepID=A0ACC2P1C1_9HYME|nr:hypothetical protein QAD02_013060 [Eretmocerus hayati]